MQSYNKTANISEIEWLVIQRLRLLQASKFGNLSVNVKDGIVADLIISQNEDRIAIRKMQ